LKVAVLSGGRAPALQAAGALAVGIFFGAWGGSAAWSAVLGLLALCGCLAARDPALRALCGATFFLAAGLFLGERKIALPAEQTFRTAAQVDFSRVVGVRGRLTDSWSGGPPLRRARMRAESLEQGGRNFPFPTTLELYLEGDLETNADRGDLLTARGELHPEEVPASARDLEAPEKMFFLTVKSPLEIGGVRPTPFSVLSRPNRKLADALARSGLPPREVVGPLAALLLGRTSELERGLAQTFRRGGLYHLVVISGLHVALLAALLSGFLKFFLGRGRARDAAVLLTVLAFAGFCGARAPVLRAALTLAFLLLSRILQKPISLLQAAGLSALMVLAADPAELFTAGFLLTYAAAVGIAQLTGPLARGLSWLPTVLRLPLAVTIAAQLATAPLLFWRFNLVSGVAWLAAPVAVPLLAFLLGDGALLLAALALHLPFRPLAAAFLFGERLLEAVAERVGWASVLRPTPPLAAVLLLYVIVALALRLRGRNQLAALTAYAVIFMVLAGASRKASGGAEFSVEALDVGQGDAMLLRSGSAAFLIDGGGTFDASAEDFGRTRLLPKLLDRGVVRLDGVLLSHPHPDHALGLFAVLRELRVGRFYRGAGRDDGDFFKRLEAVALERGVTRETLASGQRFFWAGGEFLVLRSGGRSFKRDPINNESVVLLYRKGNRRVLFTGDAGEPAERDILDADPPIPAVDLLKVGHHGSRTSSSAPFLERVCPRAALLSCGRHNRFHHPAPETVATFAAARVPLFRTDLLSDVGFRVTPDHLFLLQRGLP
jgi:competence protein ComEC